MYQICIGDTPRERERRHRKILPFLVIESVILISILNHHFLYFQNQSYFHHLFQLLQID